MLIGGIAFGQHGFHYAPFLRARNDAGYMRFYHGLVVLVLEHGLRFGPVAVVEFRDGERTFYCVAKIYRLLEAKVHSLCQPADVAADFRGEAGNQESVTNSATKVFCVCEAIIEMYGVIVSA